MHTFQLGDGVFLKSEYVPVKIVGRCEDFDKIQHEVFPDEVVDAAGRSLYGDTSVEIVGDTEYCLVIEYAVPAEQLVSKQDFDALCEQITHGKN